MKVALVNMPLAAPNMPSIQLGVLKSILNQMDISSDTYNLNIEYANRLGYQGNQNYDFDETFTVVEFLFAQNLWGNAVQVSDHKEAILFRDITNQFITDMLEYPWDDYDVVAFTATFQSTPGLCLGHHIKRLHPNIVLMFGGSSFFESAALEYIKYSDWIDYIFIGEAEYSFPTVMQCLRDSQSVPSCIKGVAFRQNGDLVYNGADKVDIRDSLAPDYSDFFDGIVSGTRICPYETSRGCWYGEKKHCTFCSLNHEMTFRSKDPEVVFNDLKFLCEKWGHKIHHISFTDNILNKEYFNNLIPRMKELKKDYHVRFFSEVKPDLKPPQIRMLFEAGFVALQIGVESLHQGFLKLLAKGQSVLGIISFLKWCRYYGIYISYNLLAEIPFEQEEWYAEQFEVIKKISHICKPRRVCIVDIQRFGVYYQQELLGDLCPHGSYDYIVPEHMDKNKIAYSFDYDRSVTCRNNPVGPTKQFIEEPRPARRRCLTFQTDRLIIDRRDKTTKSYEISESQFNLLQFCVLPQPLRQIRQYFSEADIDSLESTGTILCLEGKALSLMEITRRDAYLANDVSVSLTILKKV